MSSTHQAENDGRDRGAPAADRAMVCLSVIDDGPRISFAAYNEDTNILTLEECYANGYEVQEVIERVLAAVRPTLLLVSNRIVANENLIDLLTRSPPTPELAMDEDVEDEHDIAHDARESQPGHDTTRAGMSLAGTNNLLGAIPYQALKTSSFDVRNCKALILRKLRVRSLGRREIGMTTMSINEPVQPQTVTRIRTANSNHQRCFPLATDSSQRVPLGIYHALATLIDFESKTQIQAVGSLLSFLSTTIFRLANNDTSLDDGDGSSLIVVSDIVRANSSMFMTVSAETLASLQIFSTEHHPLAVAKGSGNAKEGFSLFSLLDRTRSRSGRERLKEWMLKPLVDCNAIYMRQNGVELFLLPEMEEARKSIVHLLANVGAVEKILARIQKCCTRPLDFLSMFRSLETAIRLFEVLEHQVLFALQQLLVAAQTAAPTSNGENNDELNDDSKREGLQTEQKLASSIVFVESMLGMSNSQSIQELAVRLKTAIDLEATHDWHSVLIRTGYDEELDDLKERYSQLPHMLREVGSQQAQQYPHLGEFIEVIFFPQIGFHIRLLDDDRWAAPDTLPEEFEIIFTEGGFTYFKSPETRALDESVGDLDAFVKDKEAMILAGIEDHILEYDIELQTTFKAIADVDCILAFASCAQELGYVRPTVVPASECCIEIRKGRHPLQEVLLKSNFVANDVAMNMSSRLNILTGPNYSGKSCYARQVGVLVYMAHLGSFIPCGEARISLVRHLFARFSSIETCSVPQSSFQHDLSQIGTILRRAGPSSLVVIDEFGKGTNPASGIALLAAAIRQLAAKKALVLFTTHFLEIFTMNILRGEEGIKVNQMAVQIPKKGSHMAFPLFCLQGGVASSSAGLACADMAGLNRAVIQRAGEIIETTRQRRQVRPVTEILRSSLRFTEMEKSAIWHLVNTEWRGANSEDMESMLELLENIRR